MRRYSFIHERARALAAHALRHAAVALVLAMTPLVAAAQVSVSPDGGNATAPANSSSSVTFTVTNNKTVQTVYELLCGYSDKVTGCSTPNSEITLAANASANVVVSFTTGSNGLGLVWLDATGGLPFNATDAGDFHVVVGTGGGNVAVTAKTTNPETIHTGETTYLNFNVHNARPVSATYTFSASCSAGATCIGVSPASIAIPANEHREATVTVKGGSSTGSATVTLTATSGTFTGSALDTLHMVRDTVLAAVNLADKLVRSKCPTFGAGAQGAIQCGDLLVAHAFPAYRSMNKARGLTLLYSSATVQPVHTAAVDYTTYASDPEAAHVKVKVTSGSSTLAEAYFSTDDWDYTTTQTHRLAVALDLAASPSGAFPVSVEVLSFVGGSYQSAGSVSGRVMVVNRESSPFGGGWWPAGVERLHPAQSNDSSAMLALADGSALYFQRSGPTTFVSPPGEFSQLVRTMSPAGYKWVSADTRVTVWYANSGVVDSITDNLGNRARYRWRSLASGEFALDSIVDPVGKAVAFVHDVAGNYVTGITIPALDPIVLYSHPTGVGSRRLLDSIVDPDGHRTKFGYDGATPYVAKVKSRGMDSVRYVWDSTTRTVAKIVSPAGASDRLYTDWRTIGAARPGLSAVGSSALVPATAPLSLFAKSTYTVRRYMGATTEDNSAIYTVDRFGQPLTAAQPLRGWTTIVRDSAGYPIEVTTNSGGGAQVKQLWDAGRLVRSIARRDTGGPGWEYPTFRFDTTYYAYDTTPFRNLTSIVAPEKDTVRFEYDSLGRRTFTIDALGRRTKFEYQANGLLSKIWEPHPTIANAYDTLATIYAYGGTSQNLSSVTKGLVSTKYRYAANGSDIDSVIDPLNQATVYVLDQMKRPTIVRRLPGFASSGGTLGGPPSIVSAQVTQFTHGDTRSGIDGYISTQTDAMGHVSTWYKDGAGRLTKRCVSGEAACETYYYGDGVNMTKLTTRKGRIVSMKYDGAGQLVSKIFGDDFAGNPDSLGFAWDDRGNMIAAINRYSSIQRGFDDYNNLVYEAQGIRSYYTTTFKWVEAWHTYDKNHRRKRTYLGNTTRMDSLCSPTPQGPNDTTISCPHPFQFSATDSITYAYDKAGNLTSLVNTFWDTGNQTWAFAYDRRNRRTGVTVPGATALTRSYGWDEYDRLTSYHGMNNGPSGLNGTFTYDVGGRLLEGTTGVVYGYDGFGQLYGDRAPGGLDRLYTYDSLGNRRTDPTWQYEYTATGRLDYRRHRTSDPDRCIIDYTYDANGNQTSEGRRQGTSGCSDGWRDMRYNVQDQMDSSTTYSPHGGVTYKYPRRFWYDALGRRIFMRSDSALVAGAGTDADNDVGYWRYFWLDDNVAVKTYNLPEPADTDTLRYADMNWSPRLYRDDSTSTGTLCGTGEWFFYEPGGVDKVLASRGYRFGSGGCTMVKHLFVPDHRGSVAAVTDAAGANLSLADGGYPAFGSAAKPTSPGFNGHEAAGGLVYMRNRWYDPNTGRFTQQDPIGFAGGSNLYAYAGNNPVSYSDPLGLLEVVVQGANAQRVIDYLLDNSSTFKNIYQALDADPSVKLVVNEATMDGAPNAFFRPGSVDHNWGMIQFSAKNLDQANCDLLGCDGKASAEGRHAPNGWIHTAASVMAHEFAHAAGHYKKAGVGSSCDDTHPRSTDCTLKVENRVRSELPQNASGGTRKEY
jgi:RHS repeat-associated protein